MKTTIMAIATLLGLMTVLNQDKFAPEVPASNTGVLEDQILEVGTSTRIEVEIVDTDEGRARGLSGRDSLDEGKGMLFVFDEDDYHSFWMKDMNFSIDMVWLDRNLRVVSYQANVSPNTFPASFKPTQPARFVLEVPAGYISRERINMGAQFSIDSF